MVQVKRFWKAVSPYAAYVMIVVSFAVTLAIVRFKDCAERQKAHEDGTELLLAIMHQFPQTDSVVRLEKFIEDRPDVTC